MESKRIDEKEYIADQTKLYDQLAVSGFITGMWSVTKLMVFYKDDELIGHIFINDLWNKSTSTLRYGGIQLSYKQLHNPGQVGLAYIMLYYVSSYAKKENFANIRVMLPPIGHMRLVFINIIESIVGQQDEHVLLNDIKTGKITISDDMTKNCKYMSNTRAERMHIRSIHYECLNLDTDEAIKYSSTKLKSKNITASPISI